MTIPAGYELTVDLLFDTDTDIDLFFHHPANPGSQFASSMSSTGIPEQLTRTNDGVDDEDLLIRARYWPGFSNNVLPCADYDLELTFTALP